VQYLKEISGKKGDEAVSPVVGVMLMLVVVIIIAAVVSGFAGGMIGDAGQKAPTLSMDVKVINTGSWAGSGFFATVTSVSKPIPTADLKIVTSWTAANGGAPKSGGNTVLPGTDGSLWLSKAVNTHYLFGGYDGDSGNMRWIAPWGGGPGVNGSTTIGYPDTNPTTFGSQSQQFGYYKLVPGTTMIAKPYGQGSPQRLSGTLGSSGSAGYGIASPYTYTTGGPFLDATAAMFGYNWELLREGDKVNIKVIHVPTGKVIFNKDVPVTEG